MFFSSLHKFVSFTEDQIMHIMFYILFKCLLFVWGDKLKVSF